jgi:dienelactone hydrolase
LARRGYLLAAVALLALGACTPETRPVTTAQDGSVLGQVSFAPLVAANAVPREGNLAPAPTPPPAVAGTLRIPPGSARVPAVVILHASGGVDGRETPYTDALAAAGIASLIVDMWTARGVDVRGRGTGARPANSYATMPDAYGALRFLAAHPRIDSDRIGVLGLSWGANMATRMAREPVQQAYLGGGTGFRSFAALYAVCPSWIEGGSGVGTLDTGWPLGPFLMLQAGQDDYNGARGAGDCEAMLARVPQPARSRVTFHVYPDALHGWDRVPRGIVTYQDAAAHGFRGGTVRTARDDAAAADGIRRVTDFFRATLAAR